MARAAVDAGALRASWCRACATRTRRENGGVAAAVVLHQPARRCDQPILDAADRLLDGWWRVFSLAPVQLSFPPDWARDPKTGRQSPRDAFGKTINYRNEAVAGDIKYLWEINRHLELVTLAQAWRLTDHAVP